MDSVYFYTILDEEANNFINNNLRSERKTIRETTDIRNLSDEMFKKNFRLSKQAFDYVLGQIKQNTPPRIRSDSVPIDLKLKAVLRFFAEGSYQHGVGSDMQVGVAQSTFSLILTEMLVVMERILCPKWINLKMGANEMEEAKQYFDQKGKFGNAVMCVDGTHIKIIQPPQSSHLYLNRKGFFSMNVMIICDHKLEIRGVNSNYQGANHDAHIWRMSNAIDYFKKEYDGGNCNYYLLGDSAYPLQPWLITPFKRVAAGTPKSRFNYNHAKCRNVVERSIGVLKGRFRCLLAARALHYSPVKAAQIVNVVCALHNICLKYNIGENIDEFYVHEEEEEDSNDDTEVEDYALSRYNVAAERIKNEILMLFET